MRHLDLLQRFPSKIIGWKNWIQKLLEVVKPPNKSNQNQKKKTQLFRTERPVSKQPSGLLTQEIEKDVLFGCESTNSRTERPVNAPSFSQSCVPVFVERVDKDKDAYENVDADQTRTVRPVSGQPTGFFHSSRGNRPWLPSVWIATCSCERSREFPRSRTREEDRESSSHREALQADLQQNNVYNPFSNTSKAMIREMGNVELCELCETIPKVQCSQCLLYWNQGVI